MELRYTRKWFKLQRPGGQLAPAVAFGFAHPQFWLAGALGFGFRVWDLQISLVLSALAGFGGVCRWICRSCVAGIEVQGSGIES